MEFVTPEEIAALVVAEIRGGNTGRDVIGALDGSVLGPSYRGGVLRHQALDVLRRLEEETGTHSVALGQLGPPELSKLLWEAELLRMEFGTLGAVRAVSPDEASARVTKLYSKADLLGRQIIGVTNFPPKQIGTFMSEFLVTGFILENGEVVLAEPQQSVPNGSRLA